MKGNDNVTVNTGFVRVWNFYSGSTQALILNVNDRTLLTGPVATDSISPYNNLYIGKYKFGAQLAATNQPLTVDEQEISTNKYYSYFFAGPASAPKLYFAEDDFTTPDLANKIKLRLINMTQAFPSITLGIDGKPDIIQSQPSMSISQYAFCDTGTSLKIKLYSGSDKSTALDSVIFNASSQQIYNMFLYDNSKGSITLGLLQQSR